MVTQKQIREVMKVLAHRGGSSTSPLKQQAARENGKLGGRPRKKKPKRK